MTPTNYRSNTSDPFSTKDLGKRILSKQREVERVEVIPDNALLFEQAEDDSNWMQGLGVRLDATGLHVERDLSPDEVDMVGKIIFGLHDRVQLWIGDYVNMLMDADPHLTVSDVAAQFEYSETSLEIMAAVCKNCPNPARADNLEFTHYRIVYAKPEKDRFELLALASAGNWTTRKLKRETDKRFPPTLPEAQAFNNAMDDVKRAKLRITSSGVGDMERQQFAEFLIRTAREIYPKVGLG